MDDVEQSRLREDLSKLQDQLRAQAGHLAEIRKLIADLQRRLRTLEMDHPPLETCRAVTKLEERLSRLESIGKLPAIPPGGGIERC